MNYQITNVAQFVALALRFKHQVYRGLSKYEYPLIPSIGRFTQHSNGTVYSAEMRLHMERQMLDEFRAYSTPYLSVRDSAMVETMIRAQHHGVPTRLMDWTTSPLVALYFAARDVTKKSQGTVYVAPLPKSIHAVEDALENPLKVKEDCHFSPPHIDARIAAQGSIFTLHADPFTPVAKTSMHQISFNAEYRLSIMGELDLLGIHSASMFPGLSGIGERVKHKMVGYS